MFETYYEVSHDVLKGVRLGDFDYVQYEAKSALLDKYVEKDDSFLYVGADMFLYTQLDGTFISKPTEVKDLIFMVHIAGPRAYTCTDGKLTIVDLRTFEKTVYSLTADEVKNVSYYATVNSIVATVGETKYLLNADGTVEAIAD